MKTSIFKCDISPKIYKIAIDRLHAYEAILKEKDSVGCPNYIEKMRFYINNKEASQLLKYDMDIARYNEYENSFIHLRTQNIILRMYMMNFKTKSWEAVQVKNVSYNNLKFMPDESNCDIEFKISNKLNYINDEDLSMQFKFICIPGTTYKLFSENVKE